MAEFGVSSEVKIITTNIYKNNARPVAREKRSHRIKKESHTGYWENQGGLRAPEHKNTNTPVRRKPVNTQNTRTPQKPWCSRTTLVAVVNPRKRETQRAGRRRVGGWRQRAHGSGRAGDSRGEPEGVVESERVESGEIVETNVRQLFYFFWWENLFSDGENIRYFLMEEFLFKVGNVDYKISNHFRKFFIEVK